MAILTPDRTFTCNGVTVNEYLLTNNNPFHIDMPRNKMTDIVGVTIHNTDWITVTTNTTPAEQYTRATVAGNMNDVRVHYYVDDKCTWQNLPHDRAGWHAADGNGNGNRKTIAIECIMSNNYNNRDKVSEINCARLAAWLLHNLKLDINHLYTHTHWLNVKDGKHGSVDYLNTLSNNYKNCPLYILPHWSEFKSMVQEYMDELENGNNIDSNESVVKLKIGTAIYPKAGKNTCMSGIITSTGMYTIIEIRVVNNIRWGLLKNGRGWIKMK